MSGAGGSSGFLPPDRVLLTAKAEDCFNKEICIICQSNTKEKLTSTATGQKRVRDAAEIRQDDVHKRLKMMGVEDQIFYHCNNNCYKSYTMEKSLKKIREKLAETTESQQQFDSSQKTPSTEHKVQLLRRSMATPRPPPTTDQKPDDLPCVICGLSRTRAKGIDERTKYRVCESQRANTFLSATSFFQDIVFSRVADLNSEVNVFAADLYAHPNCMRGYIRKYECSMSSQQQPDPQPSMKFSLFKKANEVLEPLLSAGYGFTLSEIRELMVNIDETVLIHNNEIKMFLVRTYNERIRFCPSHKKNEPLMVFSADLTPEVLAAKIRSQDAVKSAGSILRNVLKDVDFGLQDKFCDAPELRKSWESTRMPDAVLTFFSSLFNISKGKLLQAKVLQFGTEEDTSDDGDSFEDISEEVEDNHMNRQAVQMYCLFQIMFYELHNGKKKTPLHMMTAHSIYDKCKSRELITSMNRIGVSTSYNNIVRSRNLLAAHAVKSCEANSTPLPSHFTRKGFTVAALDNFDFEDSSSLSGTFSTHDTAMVLFQDCTNEIAAGKEAVSSAGISKRSCKLTTQLPCQRVQNHNKPLTRPSLPESFKLAEEMDLYLPNVAVCKADLTEFVISLIRCGLKDEEKPLPPWAGIHALISQNTVPLKKVGFLPVIPSPVTNYATVYTALKNFQNVRAQLEDQPILPIFCDEGVFRIVADICMSRPEEFDDLYPMMGMFHMTKVALRCAGTYLTGCGIDDALIESEIFGSKTVQSVLSGTHYVRSLQGMLIISEAIQTLRWNAFWNKNDKSSFADLISEVSKLQGSLHGKDVIQSQTMFNNLRQKTENLKTKFQEFVKDCEEKSELCKYWGNVLHIIALVKNLVHADREGDWELHVKTVESLITVFREFDCINYLRYGSWYLERVKKLEVEKPYLYRKFIQTHFVVKDREGKFNAVAPDMKLEQTIQRSQKSFKGIVGQTRKSEYVAQWQLVYHEVLSICNVFRDITNSKLMDHRETVPHHDLVGKRGERFDKNVKSLLHFMQQQGNPFEMTEPVRLHNFVTKQFVDDDVKKRLLDVFEHGSKLYTQLKQERFVLKEKKLSDTITKVKLPRFNSQSKILVQPATPIQVTRKQLSQAHRDMDAAKERGELSRDILSHDLLPTNTLFDGDAATKPVKHILVKELEKKLAPEELKFENVSLLKTAVVLDYMSQLRMVKISAMQNFGEVVQTVLQRSKSVCTLQELHIVFDSYLDLSVKECERIRRMSTSGTLDLASIINSTPIPVQLDKFWSSTSNKMNLEMLTRQNIADYSVNTEFPIIASGMIVNEELVPAEIYSKGKGEIVQELNSRLEEADLRVVPHVEWAVRNGSKRVIVLSNDTDVVILLLRFVTMFISQGLSELWIRYGTGKKRHFIPLHILYKKLEPAMSSVLIKAHILTGDDIMSKIGTKVGAINAEPTKFLKGFAETEEECDFQDVEKYLVRVWKKSSSCDTFDELRYSEYKRSVPLSDLPPTSYSVRGHIKRAFYLIRRCINVLDHAYVEKDPCEFGWEDVDGVLRPKKFLKSLPTELIRVCTCKACATKRCPCRYALLKCTTFCKCNQTDCRNKL